jgi:hypothetical protein
VRRFHQLVCDVSQRKITARHFKAATSYQQKVHINPSSAKLHCPYCNLPLDQAGGIYLFVEGESTMIGAYCSRCAKRSKNLPRTVQQKATFAAGQKAAANPVKFPTKFFESSNHARIAYRLLIDVTSEERLEFFTKGN